MIKFKFARTCRNFSSEFQIKYWSSSSPIPREFSRILLHLFNGLCLPDFRNLERQSCSSFFLDNLNGSLGHHEPTCAWQSQLLGIIRVLHRNLLDPPVFIIIIAHDSGRRKVSIISRISDISPVSNQLGDLSLPLDLLIISVILMQL